jgi:hypothetical protein
MKAGLRMRLTLACGLIAIASAVPAPADGPTSSDAEKAKERQKRVDQMIQESLDMYQFYPDPDSRTAMPPLTALRFVNDTRRLLHGEAALVLWAHAGRPVALASIYPWNGYLAHEFVSLSPVKGVNAREGSKVIWSPVAPGVEFRDVPDAPAPAESAVARLAQMKALSDRFKATMTGWKADNSDRAELRLLPKPIYRYDLKDATPSDPDLQDGAVFAFVLGTDPEAVLLLEAVRRDNRARWQYAFARSTYASVEARLGTAVVWTAPRMFGHHNPDLSMFAISRRITE